MRRHTKCDNIILFAILLENVRIIAFVAVQNK
jgi:hypothetical protein